MARATDKASLLAAATENYGKLDALIASLSATEQASEFTFEDRDRNLRDVLIHLYEWHQLYLTFVAANLAQEAVIPFLPAPYNWRTYPELNLIFLDQHQQTTLAEAKILLEESHQGVLAVIASFSDEALFTKKYFTWTGSTSLGSYSVSATSSHYEWALKKIRRHKRSLS